MHLLMVIDAARLDDDRRTLRGVARGLLDASIEQSHILGAEDDTAPVEPILDSVDPIATVMPSRWWRRGNQVAMLVDRIENQPVEAIFWSGDAAALLARDLAAHLEVPLIADTWRLDQVQHARRTPWVDTWVARTERIGNLLREVLKHGTVVTARPPVDLNAMTRLPDTRPSMVILDPGGPPREAQYLVGALGRVIEQRPDLEVFVELRSGASHRLWQMLQKSGLLDTVTVLDHVGALVPLVAKASVVVAPAPQGPARSLIPLSMCGGAAVVAASTACDELLIHNETALVLGPGDADTWAAALGALLSDPPLRQRLARTGRSRATDACREETALAAWITAITSSTESAR